MKREIKSNFRNLFFICVLLLSAATVCLSQKTIPANQQAIKSSPAYAEVLLRKVELETEVESLLESYTEEFPKVKVAKYELELTKKDLARLLMQTDPTRLTPALGKMLVRKNELETELWQLQDRLGKDHPQVKRAQRKVLGYQNAIKEILP